MKTWNAATKTPCSQIKKHFTEKKKKEERRFFEPNKVLDKHCSLQTSLYAVFSHSVNLYVFGGWGGITVQSKNSEGHLVGLKSGSTTQQLCDLGQIGHHWKNRGNWSIYPIRRLLRINKIMHMTSLAW